MLKKLILFLVVVAPWSGFAQNGATGTTLTAPAIPVIDNSVDVATVSRIDAQFRSSERYIGGRILWDSAVRTVNAADLRALVSMGRPNLLLALAAGKIDVNQGVAENLIKIQQMGLNHQNLFPATDEKGDAVNGLPQTELDQLVSQFPEAGTSHAGEFSGRAMLLREEFWTSITDNDKYAFKMAALAWKENWHNTVETTADVMSRGDKDRPVMIALGQEYALEMIDHLHFTENEIQSLYRDADLARFLTDHIVDKDAYFNYLRQFRFRGTIKAIPDGTPVPSGTPIMEIMCNPVENFLVETPLTNLMNKMTNYATEARRIIVSTDGKVDIIEGGTRRGGNGLLSAYAAYVVGAIGTSNSKAGWLWNIPSFGSNPHALIMLFEEEMDGHAMVLKYFPGTGPLPDTYNLEEGFKKAIRAAGRGLKRLRIDSPLPGKDMLETLRTLQGWLRQLGFKEGEVDLFPTDSLSANSIHHLVSNGAPFSAALVGGAFAAPTKTHANMVYKSSHRVTSNGAIVSERDLVKAPTLEKANWPGRKDVYQILGTDGKVVSIYICGENEPPPPGGKKISRIVRQNGKNLFPIATAQANREYVLKETALLPKAAVDFDATADAFTLAVSEDLKRRRQAAVAAHSNGETTRVGIYFGKPRAALTKNAVARSQFLYSLSAVSFGDPRDMLGSIHRLEATLPADHRVFVIASEDLYAQLSAQPGKADLVGYDWVIYETQSPHPLSLPADLSSGFRTVSPHILRGPRGNQLELQNLHLCPGALSHRS